MKVCVYGLWHLGTVTAACLASRGIATVGLAETAEAAAELQAGKAPLFEPGLDALMEKGLNSGGAAIHQRRRCRNRLRRPRLDQLRYARR